MASVSFLDQLSDYIAREGLGNSTGSNVNIFVGKYPDGPDNIIALLGQLGQQPNIYVADFEYPRFQIIVRNTGYVAGEAKIRAIRKIFHDKLGVTTENFICLYIQAQSDIIPIGEDKKGRFEFTLNMSAQVLNNDSGT